jgi:hypothetical protein
MPYQRDWRFELTVLERMTLIAQYENNLGPPLWERNNANRISEIARSLASMTAIPVVTCDACGADITSTGNCEDWRLVLDVQAKMPQYERDGKSGGAVTSMNLPRPIDGPLHFCDLKCLLEWVTTP